MHNFVPAPPVLVFNPNPNQKMVSEDRQRIIEANRSLRLIKNVSLSLPPPTTPVLCSNPPVNKQELEALLEKGIITEDAFDNINTLLPTESSISRCGAPAPKAPTSNGLTNKLNNLHLDDHTTNTPPPPSYTQSTGGGPPPLPGRKSAAPPPPPPPSKPIIAHAKAVYAYAASDARDCSFERDDRIAVYEYMNADWWMGKNLRTGQEGIFPKAYVEAESQQQAWGGEKAGAGGGYGQGNQNPYNSHVPPVSMANQQQQQDGGSNKVEENGKKFGKKLGNAAIFGAGATIGGKIVNSIF